MNLGNKTASILASVTISTVLMTGLPSCKATGPKAKIIADNDAIVKIEVVSCRDTVLHPQSPGCEDIKYGFEGGRVVKLGGTYHLITAEMAGDPFCVNMRIGHWTSGDGLTWKRIGTIRQSDGDFTGKSQKASP